MGRDARLNPRKPHLTVDPDGTPFLESDDGRLRAQIVEPADAEEAHFMMCAPPWASTHADDVITQCDGCGQPIVHRPHVPTRPPKLCLRCGTVRLTTLAADDQVAIVTTATAADFIREPKES